MGATEGTFEVVSGGEEPFHEEAGGVRLTHASGTQQFSGGIEGAGTIHWLMCYLPSGKARLVGMQRIDGSVGGKRGSFVMEAFGGHDGTGSTATWRIVEGSGTGDLDGIRGRGVFNAPGGKTASYRLEFELG